jgi:hypothetical protein
VVAFLLFLPACPKKTGPPPAEPISEESCVDAWLTERELDPYGSPKGTMYAGGTPLFDERTGQTIDRLEYVYRKHPEARKGCAKQESNGKKSLSE